MLDRATDDVIALATAAAAAVVAVFAAGFALYAAFLPVVGSAWAAFIVAGSAALVVVMLALFANLRIRSKQRAAEEAQADLARQLPSTIANIARDHPIAALLTSVIGGAVAARHPRLARDLIALMAQLRG